MVTKVRILFAAAVFFSFQCTILGSVVPGDSQVSVGVRTMSLRKTESASSKLGLHAVLPEAVRAILKNGIPQQTGLPLPDPSQSQTVNDWNCLLCKAEKRKCSHLCEDSALPHHIV
eukprot:IDg5393t1